jgi:hypothetical protein
MTNVTGAAGPSSGWRGDGYVASKDNKRWSLYGAPWLQPVAIGRKWRQRETAETSEKW